MKSATESKAVESLARFMHGAFYEYVNTDPEEKKVAGRTRRWGRLSELTKKRYRHVAKAVLDHLEPR